MSVRGGESAEILAFKIPNSRKRVALPSSTRAANAAIYPLEAFRQARDLRLGCTAHQLLVWEAAVMLSSQLLAASMAEFTWGLGLYRSFVAYQPLGWGLNYWALR